MQAMKALGMVETKLMLIANTLQPLGASLESPSSLFLMKHFLGILTHINENIGDVGGCKPRRLKAKVTRSLEELLKLIGPSVYMLTHQVCDGFFRSNRN